MARPDTQEEWGDGWGVKTKVHRKVSANLLEILDLEVNHAAPTFVAQERDFHGVTVCHAKFPIDNDATSLDFRAIHAKIAVVGRKGRGDFVKQEREHGRCWDCFGAGRLVTL